MEVPGTGLRAHQLFRIYNNHYTGRAKNGKHRMKIPDSMQEKTISLPMIACAILLLVINSLI